MPFNSVETSGIANFSRRYVLKGGASLVALAAQGSCLGAFAQAAAFNPYAGPIHTGPSSATVPCPAATCG